MKIIKKSEILITNPSMLLLLSLLESLSFSPYLFWFTTSIKGIIMRKIKTLSHQSKWNQKIIQVKVSNLKRKSYTFKKANIQISIRYWQWEIRKIEMAHCRRVTWKTNKEKITYLKNNSSKHRWNSSKYLWMWLVKLQIVRSNCCWIVGRKVWYKNQIRNLKISTGKNNLMRNR